MSLRAPEPLHGGHPIDAFDSGRPALDTWLMRHARQAQASGSAKTFIVGDGEHVAGYYSLTVGQVDTTEAPLRVSKGMGRYPIPVVILARLAVSKSYQGQGIGTSMLRDAIRRTLAISGQAGIRALLTHSIDDEAARFYQRFGFIPSPLREQQWLLLAQGRPSRARGRIVEQGSRA
jgi:GNAT superfamily N-acetyltransferase